LPTAGGLVTISGRQIMPTTDPVSALSQDEAREIISRTSFPDLSGSPELGRIGLEPEYLVLRVNEDSGAIERPRLEGPGGVLAALARYPGTSDDLRLETSGPPPIYSLRSGGRITFEPGAQIEHSTAIHETGALAMEDIETTARELSRAFADSRSALASVGLDHWSNREVVEQQLRAPRYRSMAAYFDSRSPYGRVMMRHTASLQVNLDLGPPEVAEQRWRLANLLSPIATASFACSPEDGWISARARAWQGLDPTRTGFPDKFLAGGAVDPGEAYAEMVLDSDVLMFPIGTVGEGQETAIPGQPGFRFRDWIESGHPEHGRPTRRDLENHLTTVFPEVRVRGFLEMRCGDAIPARWKGAMVVFWAGLLYDEKARITALSRLEPTLPALSSRWVDSARHGLVSRELIIDAQDIWREALAGARRLPPGWLRTKDLTVAEEFVERFVGAERTPADDLRDFLEDDPLAALFWVCESA
jgi:glutamate--cysteine ligase